MLDLTHFAYGHQADFVRLLSLGYAENSDTEKTHCLAFWISYLTF